MFKQMFMLDVCDHFHPGQDPEVKTLASVSTACSMSSALNQGSEEPRRLSWFHLGAIAQSVPVQPDPWQVGSCFSSQTVYISLLFWGWRNEKSGRWVQPGSTLSPCPLLKANSHKRNVWSL